MLDGGWSDEDPRGAARRLAGATASRSTVRVAILSAACRSVCARVFTRSRASSVVI